MKKVLLIVLTVCFTVSGWGQISEYVDNNGNTYEFGQATSPEFVEFDGEMYFIADLGTSNNTDFILSLDQFNDITLVYDPSSGGVFTDQYDIIALTVFENDLYFAMANQTTRPGDYFLYRFNNGVPQIVDGSAIIDEIFFSEMIVYNDRLYFPGRANASIAEVGLLSYSPGEGVLTVNTIVPGVDFAPLRFQKANNKLYFFVKTGDVPSSFEDFFQLYGLDTNNSANILSTVGNIDWVASVGPSVASFENQLYIISKDGVNNAVKFYRLNSNEQFDFIPTVGLSIRSFEGTNRSNKGAMIYNNQLALLFSDANNNIEDTIVLFSTAGGNTFFGVDLGSLDAQEFLGVYNNALIFNAIESGDEKLFELRESTFSTVLPNVRPIIPSLTQDISPLFGKVFNDRLYFYGNPINASNGSLRTLNFYNPKILNYDPTLNNQEHVNFFGGLSYESIVGFQLSIQDDTSFNGGTPISSIAPLTTLKQIPTTVLSDTQLTNLSGFENLESIADIEIFNNLILANFCVLQTWASNNPGSSSDWIVNGNAYNPTFSQLQSTSSCAVVCTPVSLSDQNLKAFFLDPGNASRILDVNGSPVTGLTAGGEVCAEKASEVYAIDLDGGYNNTPITSLGGLEDFTNLGELRITNAQLSGAINLTLLPSLEIFNAEENGITSVTASSANTVLRRISIYGQGANDNVLTSVSFIGTMPALNSLDISDNSSLTSIDLTRTPLLDTFQCFGTGITRLDFTALLSAGAGNFFISETGGNGTLNQIDVRNSNTSFDTASFELDASGHPNLSCVLVNPGDLTTAQNNITNGIWIFDNADVVKTECDTFFDLDNDGIADEDDNCPLEANADQADLDNDGQGDICDSDIDGDGVDNGMDAFPEDPSESEDNDNDGIGDNADTDDDNDGVLDSDDLCRLEPGPAEDNGCPTDIFFDQEDILVIVLNETCAGQNNGSIEIIIENEDFTFDMFLDGTAVGTADFDNSLIINDLADGLYQICARIGALPDFEQCFGINISTYERLSIDSKGFDASTLTARFEVSGSKSYEILVNEITFNYQFASKDKQTLIVPLEKGQNKVTITGESDCQGIYTDTIIIGNITIYPNPVAEVLNFDGFEAQGNAEILVFSVGGQLVKQVLTDLINGSLKISFKELPNGLYLVKAITNKETIEFKIIKK